jgi:hypothetical protein
MSNGFSQVRVRSVDVDSSGNYRIPVLPPGDYIAAAVADRASLEFRDPDTVTAFARLATRITITEGQQALQPLPVVTIR